ncbi:Phox homologous domain [Phytophthora cinnamomi]|uniref:Phox homologous domain n=1 Tax=Phytophthora cinnamomi TaxID=4785 RepID=UPI00355A51CD|nr:Phox homologous domain [Phytophthora cinnamomi]
MVTATRSKCLSVDVSSGQGPPDLSSLQVKVGELRLSADGTWLYLLQVACGRARWTVAKRYREIRELWLELSKALAEADAHSACTERCHFLAGFEQDKFPKKHLLLTQHKLEARASDLDQFFLKLAMRLNLCNPIELHACQLRGCPLLTLIARFFEVDAEQAKKTRAAMGFSRSISMQRDVRRHDQQFTTTKRRGSMSVSMGVGLGRRFSFSFQDRHSAIAALTQ